MLYDAPLPCEHDRTSYFLDAVLDTVPSSDALEDGALPALPDQFPLG